MTLAIRPVDLQGLRGQPWLRAVVRRRVGAALAPVTARPYSAQVTFFDDNGPKGGVACRCAITVRLPRRPAVRVEHSATNPTLAFDGAITLLERRLRRSRERVRASRRHPKKYFVAKRLLTVEIAPPSGRRRRRAS